MRLVAIDNPRISGGTGGTDPAAKPQVSAPMRALVAPQALGSTVAIEVSWAPAISAGSIKRYELQRRKGTAAWTSVSLPSSTATSVNVAVEPGANVSTRGPGRGIAEVWRDGQKVETIDLYAASVQKTRVTWAATVAAGTHTLEIRVTGTKRPAASGTRVDVDAFLVHP